MIIRILFSLFLIVHAQSAISQKIQAGETVSVNLTQEILKAANSGVQRRPSLATAAVLNVTAVNPEAPGFITVWACGVERPLASNLNFSVGSTVPNGIIAPLSPSLDMCLYSSATTDLIVDVAGWISGEALKSVTPKRLFDSRSGGTRLNPANPLVLDLAAVSVELPDGNETSLPSDISGVSLNVTVVNPVSAGFVTVYDCGSERPFTSNVNYAGGDIVANGVLTPVSTDSKVCIFSSQETDLVVDFQGWFSDRSAFVSNEPVRIADTRESFAGLKLNPNRVLRIKVVDQLVSTRLGPQRVPAGTAAAALNVTAVNAESPGFVTVWPCENERPLASNLNFETGQIVANNIVAPLDSTGEVCFFSNTSVDLVVDLSGSFPEQRNRSFGLSSTVPARFLDSRIAPAQRKVVVDRQESPERSNLRLRAYATNSSQITNLNWSLPEGTPPGFELDDPQRVRPTLSIPNISEAVIVFPMLTVTYSDGVRFEVNGEVFVRPNQKISDLIEFNQFQDPVLEECIRSAAPDPNLETVDLNDLTCADVGTLRGLNALPLNSLKLTGNSLLNANDFGSLRLKTLDVTENSVACSFVTNLQANRPDILLLAPPECTFEKSIPLAGSAQDSAFDESRNWLYVALSDRNEIVAVDFSTLRVAERFRLRGVPLGVATSLDGEKLYVSMRDSSLIEVIQIESDSRSQLEIPGSFPDQLIEVLPGVLFFADLSDRSLVRFNVETKEKINISSGRRVSEFVVAPSGEFLYVYDGSSVRKINLASNSVVAESPDGIVSGPLAINEDGSRIVTGSGRVLRSGSLLVDAQIASGAYVYKGARLVRAGGGSVAEIDPTNFDTLAQSFVRCSPSFLRGLYIDNFGRVILVGNSTDVCLTGLAEVSDIPSAEPELIERVIDIDLQRCIEAQGNREGVPPTEITELECGAEGAQSVVELTGLELLQSLSRLVLANADISEGNTISRINQLMSLDISGTSLGDYSFLETLSQLSELRALDSPNIPCTLLDDLEQRGVMVEANLCSSVSIHELESTAHDAELSVNRDKIYLSIPGTRRIVEFDLNSRTVSTVVTLDAAPLGLDRSSDGTKIYVALQEQGAVAEVDIGTGTAKVVDVSTELDTLKSSDVAEYAPNKVVVSGNPGSGGFAYIVSVSLDDPLTITRVASDRIIRANPKLAVTPDQTSVLVGEGFSPNSLYKLDTSDPSLPIVLEDDHGSVSGTDHLEISKDGKSVFLRSGQQISLETFSLLNTFESGFSRQVDDGKKLIVARVPRFSTTPDAIKVIELADFSSAIGPLPCRIESFIEILDLEVGVVKVGDDLICIQSVVERE